MTANGMPAATRPSPTPARRRGGRRRWLVRAALALGLPLAAYATATPPMVLAVQVQPAPGRTAASYAPLVRQKIGQALDPAAVRRTIEGLFATGEFAAVQAVEYPEPGGVRLVFQTQPNFFIGAVRVTHAPKPTTFSELVAAAGLSLGHIYTAPEVREAAQAIAGRLRVYGYYQAQVLPQVQLNHAEAVANVTFVLRPGPVARLGAVRFALAVAPPPGAVTAPTFVPAAPGTARELRRISGLAVGHKVTRAALDKAVERLESYYGRHGRLAAQAHIPPPAFDSHTNTLSVLLRVSPGPLVSVAVQGSKVISPGALRKLVPIFQEHAADAELIEEGRANLQTALQNRGYFDASVDYQRVTTPAGALHIVYTVRAGPQLSVAAVQFEGNRYFDGPILEARVAVQTASFLPNFIPGSRGRFSRQMAQDDAASIAGLYQANGFAQVRVTPVVVRDYHGQRGQIAVIYRVHEGPQVLVGTLDIRGNHAFSASQIRGLLTLSPGEPYSPAATATDRDSILSLYYNAGYEQARLQVAVHPAAAAHRMDVTYTLTEGSPEYVRHVYIGGERFVRRQVIASRVRIAPGSPVSQLGMIQAQRRLYNLGLFTDVGLALQNPTGIEPRKNVLVDVHEAQRWIFSEDLGLQIQSGTSATANTFSSKTGAVTGTIPIAELVGGTGVSPLVGFDATRLAMFGQDQTLTLNSRYGRLEKRGLLSYEFLQLRGNPNLDLDLNALYSDTLDVTTFRAIREDGGVLLNQQLSGALRFAYSVDFRRIAIPVILINPQEIPLLGQPVDSMVATFSAVLDHRDNPTDTHRGSYNTVSVSLAKAFQLDNFAQAYLQNSTYYPLWHNWVLARSTRIGEILPFGPPETQTITNPVNGQTYAIFAGVPIPERFFAGGADTLRGFSLNQAGPRDPLTGFPLGGDAILINNVELRFPLIGANIGGVLFDDLGNVYTDFHGLWQGLGRLHEPSTTDLNYTSDAVGFGLRYNTPVGPIRLDFGYNLNPPLFQTVGVVRQGGPEVIQNVALPHFNFYFSVGQTF